MKVLIIEDEEIHFNTLKLKLRFSKIENIILYRASLLQEAIAMLSKEKYDLIITDMHLPDSRSYDTFKIIRNLYPNTPIIVMSAETNDELGNLIKEDGAIDFIKKDLEYVDRILDLIQNRANL